jgi:hypothetical protein
LVDLKSEKLKAPFYHHLVFGVIQLLNLPKANKKTTKSLNNQTLSFHSARGADQRLAAQVTREFKDGHFSLWSRLVAMDW